MGNFDAALASLGRAVSVEPTYALTYLELGDIMLAQNHFNEAVAAFDLALARRPNDARAQRGRAAAVAARATAEPKPDEPAKAAKPDLPGGQSPGGQPPAGQAAGVPNPAGGDAEAREKKLQGALALRDSRKFVEALAIYEDMLKATPADLEAAIEKGRTLIELSRWKDAMDTFKAVIDAKGTPDAARAVALSNQGEIFAKVGDYNPAIKVTSEALRLNPRHIGALYWRGFSQYQLGAFAAALADFQQGGTLAPKESLFPSWEAFALIGAGDTAKAKDAIARSLAVEPDNVPALHARARLNLAAGDIAAAEADFTQVMRRSQATPSAVQTQQLIMLHKIMKSTDARLKPQSRESMRR